MRDTLFHAHIAVSVHESDLKRRQCVSVLVLTVPYHFSGLQLLYSVRHCLG